MRPTPLATAPHRSAARRLRGFSLIELMVVMGIIAFMLALLTAVLLKTGADAKVKATQATIEKIGIALSLYEGELRELPPDTGFGMKPDTVEMTINGKKEVLYDAGSLWRYLGKQVEVKRPDGSVKKVVGPLTKFSESELRPYDDSKYAGEQNYMVVDAWGEPIGYVGDKRRVVHNRGSFDIFSSGADRKTAVSDDIDNGAGKEENKAYNGRDDDGDGIIDNASELGEARLNGALTGTKREKKNKEVLDDQNNWDNRR